MSKGTDSYSAHKIDVFIAFLIPYLASITLNKGDRETLVCVEHECICFGYGIIDHNFIYSLPAIRQAGLGQGLKLAKIADRIKNSVLIENYLCSYSFIGEYL